MSSNFVKLAVQAAAVLAASFLVRADESPTQTPVIYTTDLYHPHQDPDDHFDLATLFALPELDIRAIVIDMGKEGKGRPGKVALQQMMALTGRTVPYATGLAANLETPEDPADQQPAEVQGGVALILKTLEASNKPVTVFTTGSLRDVAAAYNRDPDLFRRKVGRVYINAGNSGGGTEWNVQLDPAAYVRMLRSPLPVYWVPCFGDNGVQSLWSFKHRDVLESAPPSLQQFFLFALAKTDPETQDPVAALTQPVSGDAKAPFWDQERKMWCTAALLHAAGRENGPFRFEELRVAVTDDGRTTLASGGQGIPLRTFRVEAPGAYTMFLRGALRTLLAEFPLAPALRSTKQDDGRH